MTVPEIDACEGGRVPYKGRSAQADFGIRDAFDCACNFSRDLTFKASSISGALWIFCFEAKNASARVLALTSIRCVRRAAPWRPVRVDASSEGVIWRDALQDSFDYVSPQGSPSPEKPASLLETCGATDGASSSTATLVSHDGHKLGLSFLARAFLTVSDTSIRRPRSSPIVK